MNKKYYEAMDSLRPSPEAVEKAVSSAIQADAAGKVVELKTKKQRGFFKPVTAVAASLAVVLALGAVFSPAFRQSNQPGFFLTAHAATADEASDITLNKSSFVTIGTLQQDSGGYGTVDDIMTEANVGMTSTLKCTGKNIESVTYSVSGKNPYAAIRLTENQPVLDYGNKSEVFSGHFEGRKGADGKPIGIRTTTEEGDCVFYDSVTVDYDNQPAPGLEIERVFGNGDNAITSAFFKYDERENKVSNTVRADGEKAVLDFYNLMLKDLKLDVTAKFKDGGSETQTLIFEAENDTAIVKHRYDENSPRYNECYSFGVKVRAKIAD